MEGWKNTDGLCFYTDILQSPLQSPTVKVVRNKIVDENDSNTYQGICLKNTMIQLSRAVRITRYVT